MIRDIESFLNFFEGVNRRAVRDIGALPEAAEGWKPPAGDGEQAWGIGELVGHMAGSRVFFVGAFLHEGWKPEPWPERSETREDWIASLKGSARIVNERLSGAPSGRLRERIDSMDTPGKQLSGWRVLMLMVEHDIHHRSQIDTYAGIMGWPVQHIFGRSAEDVGLAPRTS